MKISKCLELRSDLDTTGSWQTCGWTMAESGVRNDSMRIRTFSAILLLSTACLCASENGAKLEVERFDRAMALYEQAFAAAKTPAEKLEVQDLRPDGKGYAVRIINQMARQGKAEWVVPYIAWIFTHAPDIDRKQIQALRDFFEKTHLRSTGAGQVAYSLTNFPDPRSLELARKVIEKNPDPKEKGIAALAVSSLIKNLGETPEIFAERRELLRQAIEQSVHEKVGKHTVADLVQEELYVMMNLTKGRPAPKISGRDVLGDLISTEAEQGRVLVLVFWSGEAAAQGKRTVDFMAKLQKELTGKPFSLIGVSSDAREEVRRLVANGVVTWKNILDEDGSIHEIFRISSLPTAFVLDKEGLIQFKGVAGPFVEMAALDLVEAE